ncbi:DNA translocase FtsK [Lachnospira eligens]|uniref:DNA segregation ATPase FtsK/SpoIIIE, S-DNA-T family n=1 Tax=Lachnospira eligens (strain ATCC 27750 / DSM 3376 / VPI C15-48 / C15-B4) TaxID=515620 RepID=C4Z516_LACE2|nr:DNA translocase FtsK [Lachnospira eligens]ACR71720.1 DNA segregation ATPase FtsK/SpoIIIE, S-DNA-T family [[Eubacterium] eligens ATCC 27750]UEA97311.1 DNA translocase FtsK [Lachnospira eligens]
MANTASRNGKKTTTQRKKTNTSGRKKQPAKSKQPVKNKQIQDNQLRNDCIILFSIACAIILILTNFNLAGTLGRGIKWFMFGVFGVMEYIFPFVLAASVIFLMVNRDLIRVARIKTVAVYGLLIVLCGMIQCVYNKPAVMESNVGEVFTYCADYKAGGGFSGGILCKVLSPIGAIGTFVILMILAIICIVIITEKSFVSGLKNVRNNSQRMMQEAKEDYSAYRQHSASRHENDMSDEEYHRLREEERAKARLRKIEKKEKQLAEKKAREEYLANARMNNVVRGVTSDTLITGDVQPEPEIDIHEIEVDRERKDEYSADIYEPDNRMKPVDKAQVIVDDSDDLFENLYSDDKSADSVMPAQSVQEIQDDYYSEELQYQEADASDSMMDNYSYSEPDADEDVYDMQEDEAADYAGDIQEEPEADVQDNVITESSVPEKKPKKVYKFPPISLLKKNPGAASGGKAEYRMTAQRLQETLLTFGVKVTITDISCGPTVTRYELQPEQGVKVSKIVSLSDDIKLNLAAADIRIEAPIPGKAAIGIEVPNKEAGSVYFRELVESKEFKESQSAISFGVGKDIAGKTIIADIAKMPHMLIAGATGSGKSVCINTIIMSILYKARPEDVRLIMVDPKVVELSVYNGIPHLLLPVVTDPKKAAGALNWAVNEMTDRYKKFAAMQVRNIKGYNDVVVKKNKEGIDPPMEKLPQIVIIIDELADLMMVAPGEVEDAICRLAQLARAAGIHMVIATQRPSVNVVTGLIKANIPSKIAFAVSSGIDSRVIIDMNGAEKLLGKGDMLYFPSNLPKPLRVQGAFVSDEEVENVVSFLKENAEEVSYDESIAQATVSQESMPGSSKGDDERDSLFADAGRFVIENEKGSIGSLQRHFKIGFNRAGRIMDQLADAKVVGPELGTKPRKVEMTMEEFETLLKQQ